MIDAYAAPGDLDANIVMPWGEMPATMALNLFIADQVTHAWDLEQTTGIPMSIHEALIEEALAISIAGVTQAFRDAGFYGPEVAAPAGASAVQRLAAFTGRRIGADAAQAGRVTYGRRDADARRPDRRAG